MIPIKFCPNYDCCKVHPSGVRVCDDCGYEFYARREAVIGVNDPKPTARPEKGMKWLRMKGGPDDGKWIQVRK